MTRSHALRPIRPLLLVAVVAAASVALLLAPGRAGAVVGDCVPQASWGTLDRTYAQQVLTLVNQHRQGLGLKALSLSSSLTAAAEWKSLHMAGYRYLAHNDPAPPVARSVGDRLLACGYPSSSAGWGENIAYGYSSPSAVMQGWLGSPGHRANIERSSYSAIGIGVARTAGGTLYWTQDFGTTTGGTAPPPPPPPSSDTQKPTTPTGLTATAIAQTSVQVRWSAASDNVAVTGYGIYVGGTLAGSTTATAATISGLACGRSTTVGVDARDAAGNRSAVTTITFTTGACAGSGDATAPSTPAGLAVTSTSRTAIGIRWTPSTDNVGVAGYRLWRGTTLAGTTTGTSFSFTGLACGTRYQLGVEALDAAGNVSGRSFVSVSTSACLWWWW